MWLGSTFVNFWARTYDRNIKRYTLIDVNKKKDKLPSQYSYITPWYRILSHRIVRKPYKQCTDTWRHKIFVHDQSPILIRLISFEHNIISKFQVHFHHSHFIYSEDSAELTTNSQVLSILKVFMMQDVRLYMYKGTLKL